MTQFGYFAFSESPGQRTETEIARRALERDEGPMTLRAPRYDVGPVALEPRYEDLCTREDVLSSVGRRTR